VLEEPPDTGGEVEELEGRRRRMRRANFYI
jgi:hypothetical protein